MKTIVFWLGRAREPWNHRTALLTGIGGSELAMIRLAEDLASRDYQVTVYADITVPDSGPANPCWRSIHDARLGHDTQTCELLVSSRCPSFVDRERKKQGLPTWLWMHDLHVGADWGNFIATYFDKVVCLTKFAKERFLQYYPKVERDRVVIIPNGVSPELFQDQEFASQHDRLSRGLEPLRLMWSSCFDRGLEQVLDLLPCVRGRHPDAQLHVYGNMKYEPRPTKGEQALMVKRLFDKLKQPGVVEGGMVGQVALAKAWQKAHLWLYPTAFEETSCITAMEAQMAGAKIVCTRVGALPETAQRARFLAPYKPTTDWQQETLKIIDQALSSPQISPLEEARRWVPTHSEVGHTWSVEIEWSLGGKS